MTSSGDIGSSEPVYKRVRKMKKLIRRVKNEIQTRVLPTSEPK